MSVHLAQRRRRASIGPVALCAHVAARGLAVAIGVLAAGCGNGGGDGEAPGSFSLTYQSPEGSGLAGAQVRGLYLTPIMTRSYDLPLGIAVAGQVTTYSGTPLAGVRVAFKSGLEYAPIAEDTTDAGGNYNVTVAEGYWYATVASGSPLLGTLIESDLQVAYPGPATVDFRFPSTYTVSGTVFEDLGPAISSSTLVFTGLTSGVSVTATCDALGDYSTLLVPGTYEVAVTPAGAAATTHLGERFSQVMVTGSNTIDFTLTAGVQVAGQVLDDLGSPLLEASELRVKLDADSRFYPPPMAVANPADGRYVLEPMPPESLRVEITPPGDSGFPRQSLTSTIVAPGPQTVDFTLTRGLVLTGSVLHDDLQPASALVELVPDDGSLAPGTATTDGVGVYEVSVFPGTYSFSVTPDDPADLQLPESRTVTVPVAGNYDVTLERGAFLTGTVTQPGGFVAEPFARVSVSGMPGAYGDTDLAGVFSFLAPVGTHTLALEVRGGPFEKMAMTPISSVTVTTPGPVTRDIEMMVAETGPSVIQGTVYGADGATPINGVEVLARDEGSSEVIGRALTNSYGEYVLVVPDAGME